ncbi:MAG: Serine hydroxymethyltransferase [Berkelbacteria bacterium GW2011_GWA1_36_9]|uniref:Serine hydroxymethyltransferase n=1 Tax=Berkelbacteria bacterium GW2011_GWA1_36_9 TaxID=1618331 RepID=A0A0G0FFL2_9BACT|nr:MAG: Serine hydroxymethyltransferase [Berkelbacteria bacterium GW2011_GWA1_36_9]
MSLKSKDPQMAKLIKAQEKYEQETLDLIPSENYASLAVREALGSVLTDKYAEGYSHKRYYAGQVNIDQVEDLAKSRALKMFGLSEDKWHANVQPYSGSPANMEIYFALLKFGDKVMGMKLDQGGHITHGLPIGFSGTAYKFISYGVDPKTEMLDYDEILKIAKKEKPKLIVCGATAYAREINFKKFSEIAKKVGAYLLADISHIAGLIVGGVHSSPFPYADVVMTTTHKTLRGPRGAIIICKNITLPDGEELSKKIDRAVFPGMQGGPHENQIGAMAVCFKEALNPQFKKYAQQIVKNAQILASELERLGLRIVSGGTDNHLMLVDLRPIKMTGKEAQQILEDVNIICNKNTIPFDPEKPFVGSGIRLGTPALTTRGMKEKEVKKIAELIFKALSKKESKTKIKAEVLRLCRQFPIKV